MHIERILPTSRRAWLKARAQDVTASTVGALFGVHDYLTVYELWNLKSGRVAEDPRENEAMRRGRLLEPVAVQMIREQHPDWQIDHNSRNEYWRDAEARIGATPDVLVTCPRLGRGIVQIKTVDSSVFRRRWLDDEGAVNPPLWIALQATLEAHLTGAQWAAVAPLTFSHGVDCPVIGIDLLPGVVDAIYAEAAKFWTSVDAGEEPQPDYARDAAMIERLYEFGDLADEIDLTGDNRIPELIAEAAAAKADRKAADDRLRAAEAEIKAKMGDASVAWIGRGRKITWKRVKRAESRVPAGVFRKLTLPQPE